MDPLAIRQQRAPRIAGCENHRILAQTAEIADMEGVASVSPYSCVVHTQKNAKFLNLRYLVFFN